MSFVSLLSVLFSAILHNDADAVRSHIFERVDTTTVRLDWFIAIGISVVESFGDAGTPFLFARTCHYKEGSQA